MIELTAQRTGSAWKLTQKLDLSQDIPVLKHEKGNAAVLRARPVLLALAKEYGQIEAVEDLPYFLQKPGLTERIPHLVLMNQAGTQVPAGALLVHESRPLGLPTGAFAVSDRSGRGVVFGPPGERLALALRGSKHLIRHGGRMVLLTIQGGSSVTDAASLIQSEGFPNMEWALRTREIPAFLPLQPTYDSTLASLGQKTRANLRYYRRRAERELNCRFLPEIAPSVEELLSLNAESMFPQPKQAIRWRMEVHTALQHPFLMGLQDAAGRWLSIVGGRRFGTSTEILWQMNRDGLPRHSLVSVMRAYYMEHEIHRGATRLYIEGGTAHSMQNAFQTETVTDLAIIRPRLRSAVTQFVRRYVPPDNLLAKMLQDPATVWHAS